MEPGLSSATVQHCRDRPISYSVDSRKVQPIITPANQNDGVLTTPCTVGALAPLPLPP